MAVTRSKAGQVIQMTAVNDSIDGDLEVIGFAFHGATAAGHEAITKEGSNGLGDELFHAIVPNSNNVVYEAFPEPIRVIGGLKLTTLDSGEFSIYVSKHRRT